MNLIRNLVIASTLSTVAGCSVILARAPDKADETVMVLVSIDGERQTQGSLMVTRRGMKLAFDMTAKTRCSADFPGMSVDTEISCTDGTKGHSFVHWLNGSYSGSIVFSDGRRAELWEKR